MKKLNAMFGVIFCTVFLVSCAVHPKDIPPAYVSPLLYNGLDCEQLQIEYARVKNALDNATARQIQARGKDSAALFWLGFPVSGSSGTNISHEVSRLKGEKLTLEKVSVRNKCKNVIDLVEKEKSEEETEKKKSSKKK